MSLAELKKEIDAISEKQINVIHKHIAKGYMKNPDKPDVLRRADAIEESFLSTRKHVYKNDLILGSIQGMTEYRDELSEEDIAAHKFVDGITNRDFWTGFDHYAPNFEHFVERGICGTIELIDSSIERYKDDKQKLDFLNAAKQCMQAMSKTMLQYADAADSMGLKEQADNCRFAALNKPQTFAQALQLVFMAYVLFVYERRYAMAFGRMDQYLYPFYKKDIESGTLTYEKARELLSHTFYKLHEFSVVYHGDEVSNIAIGGVHPEDGSDATNELSFAILDAVNDAHVPGPNLSARINKNTSTEFLDACLKVIGTGLGYPALMNDEVNIPALARYGYPIEDCRNYCMVGCIENFIQGKQPPWSDGRYNSPKYIELALNNGVCMLSGEQLGPKTGDPSEFKTMDDFMKAVDTQMRYAAKNYVQVYKDLNLAVDAVNAQMPFLSCFCDGCLERGLDINMGGPIYPSAHGVGCMGIGTVADSLAAIEKLVYCDKVMTLPHLVEVLKADFKGYADEQNMMLSCPKYGNDNDFVDKYAKWFVDEHYDIFKDYNTYDGGYVYIAIASNTTNIPAGLEIAATPDGRNSGMPLSDAASPMHGMDKEGPTAALLSLSKPDYTKSSTGTVLNQKYPPSMFTDDEKRHKLAALIRVYFSHGGQEIQINSVSRDTLFDAMEHPENYGSMVVRVSGFSAYYVQCPKEVQLDILSRTEHSEI